MATSIKAAEDYVLRIMLHLTLHEGLSDSKTISNETGMPRDYAIQLAQSLRKKGLIEAYGGSGGYMLARKPSDITVSEIMNAIPKTGRHNVKDTSAAAFIQKHITDCLNAISLQDLAFDLEKERYFKLASSAEKSKIFL